MFLRTSLSIFPHQCLVCGNFCKLVVSTLSPLTGLIVSPLLSASLGLKKEGSNSLCFTRVIACLFCLKTCYIHIYPSRCLSLAASLSLSDWFFPPPLTNYSLISRFVGGFLSLILLHQLRSGNSLPQLMMTARGEGWG